MDGLSSGGVGGGGHAHPNGGHAHAHSMIEAADMLPVPASPHSLHHQVHFGPCSIARGTKGTKHDPTLISPPKK